MLEILTTSLQNLKIETGNTFLLIIFWKFYELTKLKSSGSTYEPSACNIAESSWDIHLGSFLGLGLAIGVKYVALSISWWSEKKLHQIMSSSSAF